MVELHETLIPKFEVVEETVLFVEDSLFGQKCIRPSVLNWTDFAVRQSYFVILMLIKGLNLNFTFSLGFLFQFFREFFSTVQELVLAFLAGLNFLFHFFPMAGRHFLFYKFSKETDIFIHIIFKIEIILLPNSQLVKIIIQTFFWNSHIGCRNL